MGSDIFNIYFTEVNGFFYVTMILPNLSFLDLGTRNGQVLQSMVF